MKPGKESFVLNIDIDISIDQLREIFEEKMAYSRTLQMQPLLRTVEDLEKETATNYENYLKCSNGRQCVVNDPFEGRFIGQIRKAQKYFKDDMPIRTTQKYINCDVPTLELKIACGFNIYTTIFITGDDIYLLENEAREKGYTDGLKNAYCICIKSANNDVIIKSIIQLKEIIVDSDEQDAFIKELEEQEKVITDRVSKRDGYANRC